MNPIAIRLLNQQLICQQFCDPAQVVSHMGAIQAQEYRMMRWAVAMRTRKPSARAFKQAYDKGEIVRLHLMRGTWQLVTARDYWPLLTLCAPKALAVTRGWMRSNHISIPDEEVASIRDVLVKTAAEKGSAVKEDFVKALTERNIHMDDHRLSYHIRLAELSGTLCSGELLPMKATYALTAQKLTSAVQVDRDEALLTLTRKYFQSRQPATLEDFVWWSGLNIGDCRRGIELMGSSIHEEKWLNRTFYLTDDCRTRGFRKGRYLMIPPYDEYLISYKSRDIVLSPDFSHKAHNNSGIFQPVIAHDGIICGNWAPFKDERQAEFFLGSHNDDIQAEWERYKQFLTK
ncbi:MAG: AlkZ family DNA glycosylase [Muribaculaceae bacterium]|nr:AlkZ family DNA glycosylase [Muribaculaceae bacterium]